MDVERSSGLPLHGYRRPEYLLLGGADRIGRTDLADYPGPDTGSFESAIEVGQHLFGEKVPGRVDHRRRLGVRQVEPGAEDDGNSSGVGGHRHILDPGCGASRGEVDDGLPTCFPESDQFAGGFFDAVENQVLSRNPDRVPAKTSQEVHRHRAVGRPCIRCGGRIPIAPHVDQHMFVHQREAEILDGHPPCCRHRVGHRRGVRRVDGPGRVDVRRRPGSTRAP